MVYLPYLSHLAYLLQTQLPLRLQVSRVSVLQRALWLLYLRLATCARRQTYTVDVEKRYSRQLTQRRKSKTNSRHPLLFPWGKKKKCAYGNDVTTKKGLIILRTSSGTFGKIESLVIRNWYTQLVTRNFLISKYTMG